MTKALWIDFRERVVAVIDGCLSRRQAAARFGGSVSSTVRWHALAQRTGAATSKRPGDDQCSGRIEASADMILGVAAEQSDITLAEHGISVVTLPALLNPAALRTPRRCWRFVTTRTRLSSLKAISMSF